MPRQYSALTVRPEEETQRGLDSSRQYSLRKWEPSAGGEASTLTYSEDSDDGAKMRAASHLKISYPLQITAFQEKGGISLKDPRGKQIFPPEGLNA